MKIQIFFLSYLIQQNEGIVIVSKTMHNELKNFQKFQK